MTRTIDIDKIYKFNATRTIKQFFKQHPELNYWEEMFEWMNEHNIEHEEPKIDGKRIKDWNYSLWLDKMDDNLTYIAIIERA